MCEEGSPRLAVLGVHSLRPGIVLDVYTVDVGVLMSFLGESFGLFVVFVWSISWGYLLFLSLVLLTLLFAGVVIPVCMPASCPTSLQS